MGMSFKVTDTKGNVFIAEEVNDSKIKDSKIRDEEEEKEEINVEEDLDEDLDENLEENTEEKTDEDSKDEEETDEDSEDEEETLTKEEIKLLKKLVKLPNLDEIIEKASKVDEEENIKEEDDNEESEEEEDDINKFLGEDGEVIDLDKKDKVKEDDDVLTDDCGDTIVKDSKSSFGSNETKGSRNLQFNTQDEIAEYWQKRYNRKMEEN